MKRTFEMGGKSYTTLTAIAKELGVKRIYPRDFAKYGITETAPMGIIAISRSVNILTETTDVAETTDEANTAEEPTDVAETTDEANTAEEPTDVAETTDEANTAEELTDVAETTDEANTAEEPTDVAETTDETTDEANTENPLEIGGSSIIFAHMTPGGIAVDKVIGIVDVQGDNPSPPANEATPPVATDTNVPTTPQTEDELIAQIEHDVVDYNGAVELGAALKQISLQGLTKMVNNIKGNTWERIANEGIRKMRLIMELKKGYFPTAAQQQQAAKPSSGPSPWKKISTVDLLNAATARQLTWKSCTTNEGILRMRLIMALKAAGVAADELQK